MMGYIGPSSVGTTGAPMSRYWCNCCKVESQYVDAAYISYPSWPPSKYSTSTTTWPTSAAASGGHYSPSPWKTHVWPEPDED